jgi:hypothetical protein
MEVEVRRKRILRGCGNRDDRRRRWRRCLRYGYRHGRSAGIVDVFSGEVVTAADLGSAIAAP